MFTDRFIIEGLNAPQLSSKVLSTFSLQDPFMEAKLPPSFHACLAAGPFPTPSLLPGAHSPFSLLFLRLGQISAILCEVFQAHFLQNVLELQLRLIVLIPLLGTYYLQSYCFILC